MVALLAASAAGPSFCRGTAVAITAFHHLSPPSAVALLSRSLPFVIFSPPSVVVLPGRSRRQQQQQHPGLPKDRRVVSKNIPAISPNDELAIIRDEGTETESSFSSFSAPFQLGFSPVRSSPCPCHETHGSPTHGRRTVSPQGPGRDRALSPGKAPPLHLCSHRPRGSDTPPLPCGPSRRTSHWST